MHGTGIKITHLTYDVIIIGPY